LKTPEKDCVNNNDGSDDDNNDDGNLLEPREGYLYDGFVRNSTSNVSDGIHQKVNFCPFKKFYEAIGLGELDYHIAHDLFYCQAKGDRYTAIGIYVSQYCDDPDSQDIEFDVFHMGSKNWDTETIPESTEDCKLPTALTNLLARVAPIEKNCFFRRRMIIGGEKYICYKPVTHRYDAYISWDELSEKIIVSVNMGMMVGIKKSSTWNNQGVILQTAFQGIIPPHIFLQNQVARCLTPLSQLNDCGPKGQQAEHKHLFIWKGQCRCNQWRSRKHQAKPDEEKCTTTYQAGITLDNLILLGSHGANQIRVSISFTGNCVHREDIQEGECVGEPREKMKLLVSKVVFEFQMIST
jgi:hypothetical protein